MAWPEEHDGTYHYRLTGEQQQNSEYDQIGLNDDSSRQMLAQTFEAGTTKEITRVDLRLQRYGSPSGYVWIEIYTVSGGFPVDPISTGEYPCYSGKIRAMDITDDDYSQYKFILPKGIRLTSGTTYAIVLKCDYSTSNGHYIACNRLRSETAYDPYTDGKLCHHNGSGWSTYDNEQYHYDLRFITYYGETNAIALDQLPSGAGKLPAANLPSDLSVGTIKGWVNFDGTYGTPFSNGIRDSYNVSGLTDNGTGNYTITWDIDFADANYVVVSTSEMASGSCWNIPHVSTRAAGSVLMQYPVYNATIYVDPPTVCVLAIGEQ